MKLSVFLEHVYEAASQTGQAEDAVLKIVKGFGIDYVEAPLERIFYREDEVLRLKAAGFGIGNVYAFYDFGHDKDHHAAMPLIETAARLHVKKVEVIPGFIARGEDAAPMLSNMQHALNELCEEAVKRGVTVMMENFDGIMAPYATTQGLAWFMEQVPLLRCCFDTGNFLFSEEDALQAYEVLKSRIVHVHAKDRSLTRKKGEKPLRTIKRRKLYSSPVGHGCIPIRQIVEDLRRDGYNGIFAIEHFGSKDMLGYMRASAEWLRALPVFTRSLSV
jgi:inosose dehydratase